jgi:Flp pilus assembly protein TadD
MLLAVSLPAAADYDGYQELLDREARTAMDRADYKRAETLFWRLVELDPNDARALREAGRTAYALGDFVYAARPAATRSTRRVPSASRSSC